MHCTQGRDDKNYMGIRMGPVYNGRYRNGTSGYGNVTGLPDVSDGWLVLALAIAQVYGTREWVASVEVSTVTSWCGLNTSV